MRLAPFLAALFLPVAALAATAPPLETLFEQLKRAQSPEDAKPIEEKIGGIFLASGSPTVSLLMSRAGAAQAAGDNDTAKKLLEAITGIAPNYAEGWHARANLQRATGDDSGALASLERVILLNPRQFAAMSEIGNMMAS